MENQLELDLLDNDDNNKLSTNCKQPQSLENKMSVKEIAEILNVSENTIRRSVNELFPNLSKNGKVTLLTENQITAIKYALKKSSSILTTPKTSLEKQLLIRQAMQLQNEIIDELSLKNNKLIEDNNNLSQIITAQQPAVEFTNQVSQAINSISVGSFINLLRDEHINIGRNTLFKWLLNHSYIYKDGVNYIPYQRYNTYFKNVEQTFERNGNTFVTLKLLITGKGQIYLTEKIKADYQGMTDSTDEEEII